MYTLSLYIADAPLTSAPRQGKNPAVPALKNPRQERFARLLVAGVCPFQAYPQAGYRPDPGNPYRQTENDRVKNRVAELTAQAARRAMLTKEWVLKRLTEIDKAASDAAQHAAARGAVELIGKELGMFIDRKESGKPGDFASLQDAGDVLSAVRRELGDEAADAIAKVLARTAARESFEGDDAQGEA